ncbi:MAG: multicopper oxidase family protein [Fulvivirga sp.]
MKEPFGINRRKFLAKAGAGAAVTMIWPFFSSCNSQSSNTTKPKLSRDFQPDIDLELKAVQRDLSILPGPKTKVWVYEGKLIRGSNEALQSLEGSYLGPIIKVRKGQKVRIRFQNNLPEKSIVHWHGMHVPEQYDGHPKDVIENGETYIYEYEIMNRAGTYWFHPHPHGRTGPQVYNGLAGMLIVTDEEEEKLNLPKGEFDLPVVIQDRTFDSNNQLVYLDSGRMDRMMGFLGDRIFINGKANQQLSLKAGCAYRLRLLNGSNSRFYKLAWNNGAPVTVIGVDGSLLDKPKTLPYVMLGVAERVDLWIDLKDQPVGTEMIMKSMPFSSGMMSRGMMGDMSSSLSLGSKYPVFTIKANEKGKNNFVLPDRLVAFNRIDPSTAVNQDNPRTFRFFMERMEWTINGRTWETTGVTEEETVKLNTTEIWELVNSGGMMDDGGMMDNMMGDRGMMKQGGMMKNMMQMPHPIHLHQVQFNILERDTSEMDKAVWDSVKDGLIDDGWQDTVLLMPGMKIKIIMRFEDFNGLFLYHCHNLEHEDMGMMRNYEIT